jgi:hypothetical protein
MTDINLQTITPDTTLPTTGFLFGADSQASGSPSVFTVQSVATTLLGSTTLTGATITADAPVLNLAQTWNNAAVTFTGLKLNATDTASASGSLLLDIGTGGGTYSSKFSVTKAGTLTFAGNLQVANNGVYIEGTTVGTVRVPGAAGYYGFTTNSASTSASTIDTFISRRDPANLRFGAADAAAPVAQKLSVQSVVAGTTNTAGANLTITGSQGTGTGAGGSIIFQVAPAGSSGSVQNSLFTFLEATSARAFNLYNTTDVTTNYERGSVQWISNTFRIGTEAAGTGIGRDFQLATNGTARWYIGGTNGHLLAQVDDTYDIGNASTNRPRSINISNSLVAGSVVASNHLWITDGITAPTATAGRAKIYVDTADGDLKVIFADGTIKTIVTDT